MAETTPALPNEPASAPPSQPGARRVTLAMVGAVALVLVLRLVLYQVRETETAVVLTFGRAAADDVAPGVGFKWPWPVQEVRAFDRRLRVLRGPLEETTTRDGRAVLVASFALWRVASARQFLERAGDVEAAGALLERALRSHQAAAVAAVPFGGLVSADPAQLEHDAVEARLLAGLQAEAASLGLEVAQVGLRRLALPRETTEAVFERMREDREARAAQLLAEGQAEAGRIRAEAERERAALLDAAEAEARRTLGEAEREAAVHYAALAADPELAVFLRRLDALRALLDGRTTLVFDTDDAPFDLLRSIAPVGSHGAGR